MKPTATRLPRLLAAARRRFEHWRTTRTKPCRIPAELWGAAVRCGAEYGVYRTVQALGLDYNSLKRRVKAAGGAPVKVRRPAAFFELFTARGGGPAECTVELENRAGVKLKLELRGSAVPDVVELARRFAAEGA